MQDKTHDCSSHMCSKVCNPLSTLNKNINIAICFSYMHHSQKKFDSFLYNFRMEQLVNGDCSIVNLSNDLFKIFLDYERMWEKAQVSKIMLIYIFFNHHQREQNQN